MNGKSTELKNRNINTEYVFSQKKYRKKPSDIVSYSRKNEERVTFVRHILKCNNLITPSAVYGRDVVFTVGTEGGEADGFSLRIFKNGETAIERRIDCGRFIPVRLDLSDFEENRIYEWEVAAYKSGKEIAREKSRFETAFLPKSAKWIGDEDNPARITEFVKKFALNEKPKRARLFICGLGFFKSEINGRRTDEDYFKPAFTDYEQRNVALNDKIPVSGRHAVGAYIYDVTNLLKKGKNILSVLLGNGYYKNEDKPEEPFVSFGERKLIFELRISQGEKEEIIFSDADVLVRELPMRSDLFKGDAFDFSEKPEKFKNAYLSAAAGGEFFFPERADRVKEILYPINAGEIHGGKIYDFGINHSGGLKFSAKGEKGGKITVEYAEVLNAGGDINPETSAWECYNEQTGGLSRITQKSEYILGGGTDEIEPLFCWRCYRYVKITCDKGVEISDLSSLFIYTDTEEDGKFECSEPLFGRIYEASALTFKNNLHCEVLSDCPHREKRPYTGDGQIVAEAMLYTLDSLAIYEKWLKDIIASQRADGSVPYSAPYMGGGGGYAWSAAIAVVPEKLYDFTGDEYYIDLSLDALLRWTEFCKSRVKNGVVCSNDESWQLSDWLSPDMCEFDVGLMNTLWYYYGVKTAERFLRIKGRNELAEKARTEKENIAADINRAYFDEVNCRYARGEQGENVIPLYMGIVPEEHKKRFIEGLKKKYEERHYRIDTGIVATAALFKTISDNGMDDVAYKILTYDDYPSYAYLLKGETTLPEHWSKKWPDYRSGSGGEIVKGGGDLSHCHPMYGSVAAYLFAYVGGLDFSRLCDGKVKFRAAFAPFTESASVSKNTVFGKISAQRKNENGKTEIKLTVPSGLEVEADLTPATGEVTVDGKSIGRVCGVKIGAGEHLISYRRN